MKPKIFIGSSVESLEIASAIQSNLDFDAYCTIWKDGIFRLSESTLESLINSLNEFDFAIFILNPEDITNLRGNVVSTIRDNVIFELGLFYGKLGRNKVFSVVPRNATEMHLPTDLLGITNGSYDPSNPNRNSALGPFCEQVRKELRNFSPMPILSNTGVNGLNILHDSVDSIQKDKDYSLATENPKNLNLKIKITAKSKEEGVWTHRMGNRIGWHVEGFNHADVLQTYSSFPNSKADMQISFENSGSAVIEFYRNDEVEPFKSKTIEWS